MAIKWEGEIVHRETLGVIRERSGEQIYTTMIKHFEVRQGSEEFYLMYFSKMCGFFGLTSAIDIKLLSYLCERASNNDGVVEMSTKSRSEMREHLKISNTQVTKSFKSLIARDLIAVDLKRVEINPGCLWRGTVKTREKFMKGRQLEMRIKFCLDGTV